MYVLFIGRGQLIEPCDLPNIPIPDQNQKKYLLPEVLEANVTLSKIQEQFLTIFLTFSFIFFFLFILFFLYSFLHSCFIHLTKSFIYSFIPLATHVFICWIN